MSWLRIFTAVLAALVVFTVVGVGAALLLDGNGGEGQKTIDEQVQQGIEAGKVILGASLLAGNAFSCREGTLKRDECQRELKSNTQDLLDGLKGFDDDSFKRTTIDDALEYVKRLCDECEQMLRDARP